MRTYTSYNLPTSIAQNNLASGNGITAIANTSGGNTDMYTSTNLTSWIVTTGAFANQTVIGQGGSLFFASAALGVLEISSTTYSYNSATQFQVPTDAQLGITTETLNNFKRSLYIKAL